MLTNLLKMCGLWFHTAVVAVFGVILCLLPVWQRLVDSNVVLTDSDVYDFIVVGGGTAGSVLAARLAAERNASILLIEAGGQKPQIFSIPALGPLLQTSPLDWQHRSVPQKHACTALKENRSLWPAGRVLGGSSHLNYMLYVPGHVSDYKTWKDPGSDDWSERDVRYYFEKSEKGFQTTRMSVYTTAMSDALLTAADELNLTKGDANLDSWQSFSRPRVNIDSSGRRWTFEQPLLTSQRSKLKIKTGAVVRRVLIDEKLRAKGVQVVEDGVVKRVFAREEIILSAGAVGSAQILLLSGVGPPSVLRSANISVIKELPVGRHLRDHVTTGLDLVISKERLFSLWDLTSFWSALEYFVFGRGPWTASLCEAVALVQTKTTRVQLMAMMAGVSSDGGIFSRRSLGIADSVWSEYFAPLVGQNVASILPVVLYPKSEGHVQLDPADPYGAPLIDPNYLSHEEDVEALVEGIETVYRLVNSHAMRQAGFRFNRRLFPGCELHMFSRPDYWRCYARKLTLTSYHPAGTCRIGSVVDHQLRVKGIKNLRIADASVMPTMPGGNTNAAVAMIAEKAADLLIANYRHNNRPCNLFDIFIPPSEC